MAVPTYTFAARQEFLNRRDDLRRMEEWWSSRSRDALVLYGRRRVGKSWLFREFAHGKPAIVLVSERRAQGAQLKRFARDLAPHLGGVEPALERPADLIAALYEIGRTQKVLVVIDELPYLLPSRAEHRNADLSAIQAVMEERDSSRLKLVLCGSHIGQMTSLLGEGSPLRGRVTPLPVRALRFAEAQPFIAAKSATERIERFAVSGGMSLYLDELGSGGPLARRIAERALDSRGPLFNDPREVLEDELREPGVYFSILEELGGGERSSTDIATATGKRTTDLGPYLATLSEMGLVEQRMPLGSKPGRATAASPWPTTSCASGSGSSSRSRATSEPGCDPPTTTPARWLPRCPTMWRPSSSASAASTLVSSGAAASARSAHGGDRRCTSCAARASAGSRRST